MRFRYAVRLAALAIAPVCAKRIRVSDDRRVVDSLLSVDSVDFGGGGLRSNGDGPLSFRAQTPTSVLATDDGRRGLPTALRRGR